LANHYWCQEKIFSGYATELLEGCMLLSKDAKAVSIFTVMGWWWLQYDISQAYNTFELKICV
jgi:hypothetical protein